jgi:hypothetical protein
LLAVGTAITKPSMYDMFSLLLGRKSVRPHEGTPYPHDERRQAKST